MIVNCYLHKKGTQNPLYIYIYIYMYMYMYIYKNTWKDLIPKASCFKRTWWDERRTRVLGGTESRQVAQVIKPCFKLGTWRQSQAAEEGFENVTSSHRCWHQPNSLQTDPTEQVICAATLHTDLWQLCRTVTCPAVAPNVMSFKGLWPHQFHSCKACDSNWEIRRLLYSPYREKTLPFMVTAPPSFWPDILIFSANITGT